MRNLLFITITVCFLVACSKSIKDEQYSVRKGSFSASIVESGELQAVNTNIIVVPPINWRYANQLKITSLVEHGKKVKKGDIIAEVDPTSLMKSLFDMQSRLEVEETALDKMLIQQSTTRENIKTEILGQEASFALTKLQMEKFKFETEKKQTIKKLEYEKAVIALQKARDRQKTNDLTNQKSIYIQKIRITQTKNTIKDIEQNIKYFTIKSPYDGMVEIRRNFETDQMLKVGDRVWPGYPIASVPDLSKMKVLARVNETDIGKLKNDQITHVRLQAFPKLIFDGKITRIFPICYKPDNDSKVNVFDFEVLLTKADEALKPGMSVSCEVFFAQYEKVMFVENECVVRSDTANYIVLEKDRSFCPVKLGASNNKFTIISGNINEGEKVIPINTLQTSYNL